MKLKNYCFKINSYNQAYEVLNFFRNEKIHPVIFIKYYLINNFGINWLVEFRNMLQNEIIFKEFKIYVEVNRNYGLFITLVENKIDFINVKADKKTMKSLKEIGKLNKVLINPNFSVVDLSNIKKITAKLNRIIKNN